MTIEQVLRKARKALKPEHAWVQRKFAGMYNQDTGECKWIPGETPNCFCSVGAIEFALGMYKLDGNLVGSRDLGQKRNDAVDVLEQAIHRGVIDWNDSPDRQKGQVMDAFDKAIRMAKERRI